MMYTHWYVNFLAGSVGVRSHSSAVYTVTSSMQSSPPPTIPNATHFRVVVVLHDPEEHVDVVDAFELA